MLAKHHILTKESSSDVGSESTLLKSGTPREVDAFNGKRLMECNEIVLSIEFARDDKAPRAKELISDAGSRKEIGNLPRGFPINWFKTPLDEDRRHLGTLYI